MNNDELFRNNVADLMPWFKVVDFRNPLTLDDFSYESGVPDKVGDHCQKCVTVNQCYFKNEKDKKPEEFDYSNTDISRFEQGLYHPNCECKKLGYATPMSAEIKIRMDNRMDYLFDKKNGLIKAWGYLDSDKKELEKIIVEQSKNNYASGNYSIYKHDKYGFAITIYLTIPGKGIKLGRFYKRKSGYIVYPNKTLRNTTPIGGIWK